MRGKQGSIQDGILAILEEEPEITEYRLFEIYDAQRVPAQRWQRAIQGLIQRGEVSYTGKGTYKKKGKSR